ncbi:MAG: adenosylcobinamide-phosphate synthase CbiB [Pseudomonadota bacterium]
MTGALLTVALILDAALGEPRWLWSRVPHPAVVMGRAVAALDHLLNRGDQQIIKGAMAATVLVAGAGLVGWALSLAGPAVQVLCAAILLAQRSLVDHVAAVASGLRLSLDDGRQAAAMIVSRDVQGAEPAAVSRAAIESASENLSDGVIAPAFWFLIAGLPGIAVYKAVNTADSMIGYRTERYEVFGKAAARLDDVLNWVPARLTGLLIAVIGGSWRAWGDIAADARRHRSPNAGWPEAAMARALGIALAGPRVYDGTLRDLAWVNGDGRREIGAAEIDAAVQMLWKAWGAALVVVVCIAILQGSV